MVTGSTVERLEAVHTMQIERPRPKNTDEAILQIYDIMVAFEDYINKVQEKQACDDKRIRHLEIWQASAAGAFAVIWAASLIYVKALSDTVLKHLSGG